MPVSRCVRTNKILRLRSLLPPAALVCCLFSCVLAPDASRIALRCILPAAPRTVHPEESTDVVAYSITGVGPAGNEVHAEGTSPIFHFDGMLAGNWTIIAAALSPSGKPIYQGRIDLRLAPGAAPSYELLLESVSGQGNLVGSVGWPAGAPVDPAVVIELTPLVGSAVDVAVTALESSADFGPLAVEAGYYRADVVVLDGDEVLAGRTEVLRVVAGFTTRLDLEFTTENGRFSGLVGGSVMLENDAALEPVLDLPDRPLLLGETAVFLAGGVPEPVDFAFSVDGIAAGHGETLYLTVTDGPFFLGVTAEFGLRAGSTGTVLSPVEPVLLGGVAYRRSFVRGRDGVPGLDGARAVAVSSSGLGVFVAGYGADSIVIVGRDPITGRHDVLGAVNGPELDGVTDLLTVVDGGSEYLVAAASRADRILLYRIVESGRQVWLEPAAEHAAPGVSPARLAPMPGDAAFLVCDAESNQIRFLAIAGDPGLPELTTLSTLGVSDIPELTDPVAAAFGHDGQEIFVGSGGGDAVLHLTRDAGGEPVLFAVYQDGDGPVDSLNQPESILLSSDGLHLYVSSYYDSAVTWFSRPAIGQAFSLAGVVRDGEDGAAGLRYARGLVFSPDGTRIYVAGSSSDALVSLTRQSDGSIAYESMIDADVLGAEPETTGLDGPRALGWSASGGVLYVASSTGDALLLLPTIP